MTLKTQNFPILATLLFWNFVILYAALALKSFDPSQVLAIGAHWHQTVLPAGAAIFLVGLLTEQFSPEWKARLVFWKWHNALPASQAFTKIGPKDARVDLADLERRHGPFPQDPTAQNRAWYKLYKNVASHPTVVAPHKQYLLYRDYACLAVLMLFAALALTVWQRLPLALAGPLLLVLFVQYLLARNAAAVTGCRMVGTVLARV